MLPTLPLNKRIKVIYDDNSDRGAAIAIGKLTGLDRGILILETDVGVFGIALDKLIRFEVIER